MISPWHTAAWQTLMRQCGSLHHALLLTGPQGIGKQAFARHLAQALLCETNTPATLPCGTCLACHWFSEGNHPDFRLIEPVSEEQAEATEPGNRKKPSQWIVIEQIREIEDFAHLSAHRGGRKVAIVSPAEALYPNAANALLKILEEPPPGVQFILVSHQFRRILPTVRSRCQRYPLPVPPQEEALAWLADQNVPDAPILLAEAGGAPLLARALADADVSAQRRLLLDALANPRTLDPLALAEALDKQKTDVGRVADWLTRWVHDLAGLGLAGSLRYYPDQADALAALARELEPRRLMRFQDHVLEAKRHARHPLNIRLVFEQLLMAYQQAVRPVGRNA
jgi:DNA polymerase-3 subunit delta'